MNRTMRVAFTFLLGTFPTSLHAQDQPIHVRVLFIGNSYTYGNDLPRILEGMAWAARNRVILETGTQLIGGATLKRHWTDTVAVSKIRRQKWDYVVLQEQSLLPLTTPDTMLAYGIRFGREIHASGAKAVVYVTWPRKNRPSAQDSLTAAYLSLARQINAVVVPAGPAWAEFRGLNPNEELYFSDGSHPSPLGSYLSAATFFHALFQTAPPPSEAYTYEGVYRGDISTPERIARLALPQAVAEQLHHAAAASVRQYNSSSNQ